ncbi:MAG: L,D-transpeptidase family protein [Candidatus Paceibacterota bacterium]|jgi:hypothetical protein
MIFSRINSYISKARANGVSDEQIKTELLAAGWNAVKIEKTLNKKGLNVALLVVVLVALGLIGGVWVYAGGEIVFGEKSDPVVKDIPVPPMSEQVDSVLIEDKINPDTKDIYIKDKVDFVEADLDANAMSLYQGGLKTKSYEILAFGKDESWWETPTGDYEALNKETRHFSSIGEVWMPWSIQFYGNFFIHGWPYYEGGEPVEPGHAGGCIRLSVDDAKDLYQYVNKGTPILVRETTLLAKFGSLAEPSTPVPEVSASSFLVENISTGEKYAKKNSDTTIANAPIAKLMTAVIASELIYIERYLPVESEMIVPASPLFEPQSGEEYVAFDLFYPLLIQSSDTAANIISSSLGRRNFVDIMNNKFVSLKMKNTHFESTQNLHDGNTSTLDDMARLLQYVYFKRAFIYKVTKGLPYRIYSGEHSTSLSNQNILVDDKRLVGIQQTHSAGGETVASVWEVATPSGVVPMAIVLAGSKNAEEDTKKLFEWVENNGALK